MIATQLSTLHGRAAVDILLLYNSELFGCLVLDYAIIFSDAKDERDCSRYESLWKDVERAIFIGEV